MTVTLHAIREVQIPLLAAMLLGACGAKLAQVLRAGGLSDATDAGPSEARTIAAGRPNAI